MASPTSQFQSFPFLKLPPELRLMVYSHAIDLPEKHQSRPNHLKNDLVTSRQERNTFLGEGAIALATILSAGITRTNKAILGEVITTFLGRIDFSLDFTKRCRNYSPVDGLGGTFHYPAVWKQANMCLWDFQNVIQRLSAHPVPLKSLTLYLLDHTFEPTMSHYLLFNMLFGRGLFRNITIRTCKQHVGALVDIFKKCHTSTIGTMSWDQYTKYWTPHLDGSDISPESECIKLGGWLAECENAIYQRIAETGGTGLETGQHGLVTDSFSIDSNPSTGPISFVDIVCTYNRQSVPSGLQIGDYKITARSISTANLTALYARQPQSILEVWKVRKPVYSDGKIDSNIWGLNGASVFPKSFRRTCFVMRREGSTGDVQVPLAW